MLPHLSYAQSIDFYIKSGTILRRSSLMEILFIRVLTSPLVVWILKTKVVSWFLMFFVPFMELADDPPGEASFIYLITYGASEKDLTRLSWSTTKEAEFYQDLLHGVPVIGCTFKYNPAGAQEWKWRKEIITHNLHWAGDATSTTDERELIMQKALDLKLDLTKPVLVMSGGAQVRRVRLVLRYFHPNLDFYFRCSNTLVDDPNNPMRAQRQWQTWVVANLVGCLFYKLIGVKYFADKNLAQPT